MFQRVELFIAALCLSIAVSSICAVRTHAQDEKPSKHVKAKGDASQVRGRVVMESDGSPVANAAVRLVSWTKNNTRYDVKKARSDKNGEFVFDGIGAGQHRLAAFFEDYSSRKSLYKGEAVDLASAKPVTLTLAKMPRIAVKVVSKDSGKPIAGASVQLVWSDTERENRADENGTVVLRALTPEVWHVKVQSKGFAAKEEAVNLVGTETANVTFELEPGGKLFGTVRDEVGNAVAGAGISVRPANSNGMQSEYVKTDGQGGYHFDNLALNQGLGLSISKKDFLDTDQQVLLSADSGTGQELNIVLKRRSHGGTLRGTVTDVDGKPIVGAKIANQGRRSSDERKATTDERGQFVLNDVYESGSLIGHELVVKAKSYAPQRTKFKPGPKDKPGEIAIKMEPGHRIRGRVIDEMHKPIAGVRIYHSRGNFGAGTQFGDGTTTDKDGVFEFDSLPKDAPFSFAAKGYSEIEEAKLQLDGDLEVVVTMQEEGIVRGKVVDAATKKPISPFNVRITFSPDRRPNDPGHHLSGARSTTPEGERFSNPEGSFLLDDLIDGMPLQVTVSADGYERQVYRRIEAKAKSAADEIVFPLLPIDESKLIAIRGRLVDDHGKAVAGAEMRLITADKVGRQRGRPGGFIAWNEYPYNWQMIQSGQVNSIEGVSQVLSTVSDKGGAFAFERIRPAPLMEIAYWGEGVSQDRREQLERLTPEERSELILKTVSPGIVRGTIDRKALPDVSSIALSPTKMSRSFDLHRAEVRADQTKYEIRNIPPGQYELQVHGAPIRTERDSFTTKVVQRHAIEVQAGNTVTLDLGENN